MQCITPSSIKNYGNKQESTAAYYEYLRTPTLMYVAVREKKKMFSFL